MGATYKRSKESPKGIIDEESLVEDLPEENLHELTKQEEYHEQE